MAHKFKRPAKARDEALRQFLAPDSHHRVRVVPNKKKRIPRKAKHKPKYDG